MAGATAVLIIDDDDSLRELYRLNLERHGVAVTEASGGADGLGAARKERPDVIVLDLTMPGTDGWMVLRELKADDALRDVPVVVLTAHADEEVEERARDAGAVAYVAKPVDAQDLIRVVMKHAD